MAKAPRDWLERIKFSAPPLPDGVVERASLQALLRRCLRDSAITVVHAPAGFGKSTLLAQVAAASAGEGARVAWLTLGEEDRQAETLAMNLAQSLTTAGLPPAAPDIGSIVHALEAAGASGAPALLVLDEAEHIEDKSPVSALLERLGMVVADSVRLLVGSRHRPGFASAQLRLAGRLSVVGPVEMRFMDDDATALLGEGVPAEARDALLARAEGWPVILQLARQLAASASADEDILSRLREPDSDIFRYMAEQIFDRLAPDAQRLLTEVAILERIDAAAAAAVTGEDAAYALLQGLRHLQPIMLFDRDTGRGATIHPLFRDFLIERLHRAGRSRERELRLRAAAWYASQGRVMAAVQYALAAGDAEQAARIIEESGGPLLNVSEGAGRVRTLLQPFQEGLFAERPGLQLTRLLEMCLNDRAELALPALDALRDTLSAADATLRRDFDYVEAVLALLEHPAADGPLPARQLADSLAAARSRAAEEPRALALYLPLSIITAQRTQPLAQAESLQAQGLDWYAEQSLHRQRPWGLVHQALIATAAGRYDEAMQILTLLLPDTLQGLSEVQAMLTHLVNALVAAIAYERGDMALCQARLARLPAPKAGGMYEVLHASMILRARASAATGDRVGALEALAAIEETAARLGLPNIALQASATHALLLQAMGRDAEAALYCQGLRGVVGELTAEESFRPWLLRLDSCLALLGEALAAERPREAIGLAERLVAVAREHGRQPSIAAAELALARARHASGDRGAALDALQRALSVAAPLGCCQLFLDQGPLPPLLLRELSADGHCPEGTGAFVDQLLARWNSAFHREEAADGLLTGRELDILSELALGHATKVAARNLDIAPETVKHHLKRIFRKLDVHDRSAAVQAARARALIP